jgi:LPS-assembly lipoprotein|tara:strand:+ start:145 stop:618 length:474 start_codon:yes stop_codon:yes gene_type:complete
MKKIFSYILLLILTLSIASCGYQLRGSQEINFKSISVSGGSSSFYKVLQKIFKRSGVKIEGKDTEMLLEITNDTFSKKILSLSSTGKVREYQINYEVSFRFKIKDGQWGDVINIKTSRDYTYDDKNIISKSKEEARLVKGMQEQLIRTIATQISVIK